MAILKLQPRALLFDVFGTCVDWRSTVTRALKEASRSALENDSSSIPENVRLVAADVTEEQWGRFAQEWRNTYKEFVKSIANDRGLAWKTVDEHHFDALGELLTKWNLQGLWQPDEVKDISLIWHKLDPWSDSGDGIKALNTQCSTCTLSNGISDSWRI